MPVKREVPVLNYHAMLMKGEVKLWLYIFLRMRRLISFTSRMLEPQYPPENVII